MLSEQDKDSKLEMFISQLRMISNEDRQKSVWQQNLSRHTEQDHEYKSLKKIIFMEFLDHKKRCQNYVDNVGKFIVSLH